MTKPKPSPWTSTPLAKRHRKPLPLTLSDEERERLTELASERGVSRSRLVGQWIGRAWELRRRRADRRESDDERSFR